MPKKLVFCHYYFIKTRLRILSYILLSVMGKEKKEKGEREREKERERERERREGEKERKKIIS